MAEPKKRLTSTRSGKRRSHLALEVQSLSLCPKCKSKKLPHRICPNCGFYKGVDLLKLEEKARAKEGRRKARAEEEKEGSAKDGSREKK